MPGCLASAKELNEAAVARLYQADDPGDKSQSSSPVYQTSVGRQPADADAVGIDSQEESPFSNHCLRVQRLGP